VSPALDTHHHDGEGGRNPVLFFFEIMQSGQFEPIKNNLENGPDKFRLLMMIFVFCTSIILLNVLIGKLEP
jgi:hypothetical protein